MDECQSASRLRENEVISSFRTTSLSTRRPETGSGADTEVRMDKLTGEETKNKRDPCLDVKCRSGQVVFVLERTLAGLDRCYER